MYKRIIIFFVYGIISSSVFAQEIILGSSIRNLTNLITNETSVGKTDLGLWVENEIYLYEISNGISLLISCNYYPFGVLINGSDQKFLIDIDGDSIIDIEIEYLFVPHWVVSLNSKEKNDTQNVVEVLNMYYTAFQNNVSIRESELILSGAKEIVNAAKDISYLNRDILYLFYLYDHLFVLKEYQLCIKYLSYLDNEIIKRYSIGTHPIIYIYLVETLYKLNDFDRARNIDNSLLEYYPDCIPGLVYQVLLETDIQKKDDLTKTLIKNHGDHWLVQEKLL
jgi:tetratricopeptide (TPR) repeat protein